MVRKRSVVWSFFKSVDSESLQCVLCGGYVVRNHQGTTTNMLRHLRAKHPNEGARTRKGYRVPEEGISISGHEDMETDSEQFCSVVVALDDEDSDIFTTENGAGVNSSVDGILEATQGGPAEQITHEEARDDHPVKRKRSLIWRHYERMNRAARCRICMKKLQCSEGGSTSNLHRHMSKRHPEVFSQLMADKQNPPPPHSSQGSDGNGETSTALGTVESTDKIPFSVEMAIEDEDCDALAMGNDTDVNSAIDGILEAAQGGPAEQMIHEEARGDHPVRRTQNKQSQIWSHYEHLESLQAVRCRICMKKLQYFNGGSTINLHRHMAKRHPEMCPQLVADGQNPPRLQSSPGTVGATAKRRLSAVSKVSKPSLVSRVFKREQELIEALRRAQREEARALENQRELLEKLRATNAREAAAEREQIESLRKAQLEEANDLSRQREELEMEKEELHKKWEDLHREREGPLLFSSGQEAS